ncbi:structural maintenance of chromosomes protein 1-like [Corylus avellana]|uniref:structural maintenance of chromosomes protein 1-like n=1 Tax=Corylus avellana TaxID=13451 RepID=UPI00286BDF0E|nr:structural maintenance of chromosomes protein 1-like [Corylus avellana]
MSNLMDAISFVLGVRTGQLRGAQLKDLIYAYDDREKERKWAPSSTSPAPSPAPAEASTASTGRPCRGTSTTPGSGSSGFSSFSKENAGMRTAKLRDEKEVLDRQQHADIEARKNLEENLQQLRNREYELDLQHEQV